MCLSVSLPQGAMGWSVMVTFSGHTHLHFTVRPILSGHSIKEDQKLVFNTNYRLMQVKSIAECSEGEHSAILSASIKLPFEIKTFVFSIFEWPLKAAYSVTMNIFRKKIFSF